MGSMVKGMCGIPVVTVIQSENTTFLEARTLSFLIFLLLLTCVLTFLPEKKIMRINQSFSG